jgi:hypothetical protein
VISLDAALQNFAQQLNILFQPDTLSRLIQMLPSYSSLILRIVQQQISQLRSLLHQINLRHPLNLAPKVFGGNAQHLNQPVTRSVETQRLIKITRKQIAVQWLICHEDWMSHRPKRSLKIWMKAKQYLVLTFK